MFDLLPQDNPLIPKSTFMEGTVDPAKQQQQAAQQQALIEALRGFGQQQQAPAAQGGRVVSTGSATSGIDPMAMGTAIKALMA